MRRSCNGASSRPGRRRRQADGSSLHSGASADVAQQRYRSAFRVVGQIRFGFRMTRLCRRPFGDEISRAEKLFSSAVSIRSPLSSPIGKIFLFRFIGNRGSLRRSRAHKRGASRSSRTLSAGCDGLSELQRAISVRTNDTGRTAKSCGPGAPTLALSLRGPIGPSGDGG